MRILSECVTRTAVFEMRSRMAKRQGNRFFDGGDKTLTIGMSSNCKENQSIRLV